ncbi:hypothetical protein CBM2606_A40074 [Cupriavidus taiwanensis]|nr:hypothetical protein CBM2606_A40074 [Cupriavidus taiwanensis]
MLPLRSRFVRQGHPRHDPPAPVRQGRAGPGGARRPVLRRTGAADRPRRGDPEEAGAAVPHHRAVHRRHGLRQHQDLRPRSVDSRAEHLPRDQLVLQHGRFPGAPHAGAHAHRAGQAGTGAHAERLGPGRRPHAGGDPGKLPERGRLGHGAGRAAAVHGRHHPPGAGTLRHGNKAPKKSAVSLLHRLAERGYNLGFATRQQVTGEVAEWSNVPDSKSGVPATVPWVRIPPSPPKQEAVGIDHRQATTA